jgi:muramoyltetrapeptide carboxypeptidase LdcA involved in peptidoglycan recycling
MKKESIIKPKAIKSGATVGIYTPSFPANVKFRKKYEHGIQQLINAGYKVIEGFLTANMSSQGYRSGGPKERAKEFMDLVQNPDVDFMMSTIGGCNSSSMIPYLDFNKIRENAKIISGFSDVTSLHMAILTQSGLSTFYGPAVVPSFGEWPTILPETLDNFRMATEFSESPEREVKIFDQWSNHFRNALTDEWMSIERQYEKNPGWKVLVDGHSKAPIIVANLNTLGALAGTPFFPKFNGEILLLEEMDAPLNLQERSLRHMQLLGVFENISGLIIGKPEKLDIMGAPFSYDDLILELIGTPKFPVVSNFDCGHTHPMLTISQMVNVELFLKNGEAKFKIMENMVGK